MQLSDFDYALPEDLIAQIPSSQRTDSRLLCLEKSSGKVTDRHITDLPDLLTERDLLVFNDTRVIPARLLGNKDTGGQVEVMVERIVDDHRVLAQVRASKSPKPGSRMVLEGQVAAVMVQRHGELFELEFDTEMPVLQVLENIGRLPLPPYITRQADTADLERYQTVYARHAGAVAAPTAGLHFDQDLLARIRDKGVATAYVTLHVGAGTFQPVRTQNIEEHTMHAERVVVDETVCKRVQQTREQGGRVIAVGTTSVRSLESAAQHGQLAPYEGETRMFIYPGYRFQVVDALLTNFHLPRSSLLMLVTAFGGYAQVMAAYRHAVAQRYRFFSYGDAMFIYGDSDSGSQG